MQCFLKNNLKYNEPMLLLQAIYSYKTTLNYTKHLLHCIPLMG